MNPVINWTSFVLTSDGANYFYKYWFPGFPWEHQEQYWKRSPLSLVGNVTTPTMLLTGEADSRTPISETEQYYQALKLRGVPPSDGEGLLQHGYTHVFVLPAEGGTPRQLTSGDFDHSSQLSWSPDGKALIFSANRLENWNSIQKIPRFMKS